MKVEGLARLQSALDARAARAESAAAAAIGRGVIKIAADARVFAPQITGRLDASIVPTRPRTRAGKVSAAVVCDGGHEKPIAAHIEFGTRYMAPEPFMRPAARRNFGPIRAAIADSVRS